MCRSTFKCIKELLHINCCVGCAGRIDASYGIVAVGSVRGTGRVPRLPHGYEFQPRTSAYTVAYHR